MDAAIKSGTAGLVDAPARVSIYRPFFIAGILSVLTTGCLLGAIALWGISQRHNYVTGGWTPWILAHANSQLFGWVGLFVMGFALQQHPPRSSRVRLYYILAYGSLGLILAGIVLRFLAEPMVRSHPAIWLPVGVLSALLQAAAVLLFVANTGMTRARVLDPSTGRSAGLPWQSCFVFASLAWWLLVAAAEPIVFSLSHQADSAASVAFVAKWFLPYREAQFLGFVVNMVFGVGLARFPDLFGFQTADRRLGLVGFVLWNGGLVARMGGWLSYFDSGLQPGAALPYTAGVALLASGAFCLVVASRAFSTVVAAPIGTRETVAPATTKFIRAALGWLLASAALLLLEPLHLRTIGAPFSHAYVGAIRHAVTVGLISQMIVGVSMTIVPRLRSAPPMSRAAAWTVFALLNIGNALRVGCEIATDYSPRAFGLMGVTGFVKLSALLIWGVYLTSALIQPRHRKHPSGI